MINGEPIFSIDKAMFDDDKFKMKLDGVLFNGFIEWDVDCDDGGIYDCSRFSLEDQNGSEAPKHVMDDDLVKDAFAEIKNAMMDEPYWGWRPPLDPIAPKQMRATA